MSDPRCQRIQRSPARLACGAHPTTDIARVVRSMRRTPRSYAAYAAPSAAGARLEQSDAASCATNLERAAFLRDAIDSAAFTIEHQMLWGVTATSEKRPGPSSVESGIDVSTRPEISCSLCSVDERDRPELLDDPQVALHRVNLEGRHLVEAGIDAGEARHAP